MHLAMVGPFCAFLTQVDTHEARCPDFLHPSLSVWQDGSVGQLGNGAAVDSMLPVPVLGNRTYVVIEVGEAHTCAITEAGAMWCWGRAMANGQTGYINEPAEVGGGHKLVAASSAGGFTCGLDVAGDVWCFGASCQLGNAGICLPWWVMLVCFVLGEVQQPARHCSTAILGLPSNKAAGPT